MALGRFCHDGASYSAALTVLAFRRMRTVKIALLFLLSVTATAAAQAPVPADFTAEAKLLYRAVACGGTDPLPSTVDTAVVDAHCKELRVLMEDYKKRWLNQAMPYLAKVVPASGIPQTVVYPFGGSDLVSALATFPATPELTTLSLELSGDPRKITKLNKQGLKTALEIYRPIIGRLFLVAHSKTTNLSIAQHGDLPGELVMDLVGLAIHDLEPVSLRYFLLEPDGSIRYLTDADIKTNDANAAKLKGWRQSQAQAQIFANMEVGFRKRGDASAPVRVFRHIGANLDNDHLKADARVLKHLEKKGKITAMTKAASFLLWWDSFAMVRNYLLANMEWMISDATGIPPRFAKPAGFEQITYGAFDGPFLEGVGQSDTKAFKDLWKANPRVELPFRYGYPDNAKHSHMMVTRKKP
jgi:hypothetical protein